MTTQRALGGDVNAVDYCGHVLEGVESPVVFGLAEPYLSVVFPLQGPAGSPHVIEVRRPNGSVFASFERDAGQVQAGHLYYVWHWNGLVAAADSGIWSVTVSSLGSAVSSTTFRVGAVTVFGPRVSPPAGRSFRMLASPQRDTLRVTPLGDPVTWSLLSPPSAATLIQDSILVIGTSSDQPLRSAYFQAIATGSEGRRDTAWYHIVDTSKLHGPNLEVEVPGGHALELAAARPNPFTVRTALRFQLRARGHASLAIFDLAGRRIRTLVAGALDAGTHSFEWDGCDESGTTMPAGIYFTSLEAGGTRLARRIVRLRASG